MHLNICHFYPDLLNLYGDRGNLIALRQRCAWRGIECTIESVSIGQPFDAARFDMAFMGGGQDYEQSLLYEDLFTGKGVEIRQAVEDGLVMLCVCGGYQLMGHYYQEQNGKKVMGIGALDLYTEGRNNRIIGDLVAESDFLAQKGLDPILVGFENHSGRTWLGPEIKPLARVVRGGGNNGEDQTEGAVHKNTIGTYAHGSFLPKNPAVADWMILTALQRQGSDLQKLPELDDEIANNARSHIITCK